MKSVWAFFKSRKISRTIGLITTLVLSGVETPGVWAESNEWTSLGWPEGGAVERLIIDPQNPSTVYATGTVWATNLGVGIFKSTNGGATWRPANFGLTTTAVSSLAMDTQVPSTLYAGTWGSGVFKSTDGGESWGSSSLPNTFITALTIDERNPRTVYAAASGSTSAYRSTDGGSSWSPFSRRVMTIDPQRPGTIYAGADVCCDYYGLHKSSDGGTTWIEALAMSNCNMRAILITPQDPSTFYAAASCLVIRGGDEVVIGNVFKSTDAGASWSTVNSGLPETWSISALAIDPKNAGTLYAGTPADGVFKSTDGGTSWQAADPSLRPPSVNVLAIDPQNPDRIYMGTGTGVLKSTDGGTSWSSVNTGLQANGISAVAVDPRDPSTLYAAAIQEWIFNKFTGGLQAAPGRVFKSTDWGTTWNSVNPGANAVTIGLAVDPRDGSVYAGTTEALFKSADGGASWTVKSGMRFGALAIDPQNPSTLYAPTNNGVSKSTDGGTSWRTFNSGLSATNNVIPGVLAVAVDPTTPSTVYAATGAITGAYPTSAGLFKSTDGAINWSRVNSLPTETSIRALVIAPQIPSAIYAATSAGLFKSTNEGASWSSVNFGMDASAIFALAIDPQNPSALYAGTTRGLFTITFATQRPLLVTSIEFNQASVRIGDSYIARASGTNLTAQTYFDIRYRAPGSSVVEEALNWQTGAAAVHSISAGTGRGTWTINGVRAHEVETDHSGSFSPVSLAIRVDP